MIKIKIIAAVDSVGGLGKDNKLVWKIPSEMRHFIKSTSGKTIVMGRKTFDSIPGKLPNRKIIVLSHSKDKPEGADYLFNSVKDIIDYANKEGLGELWICGGGIVYSEFLPLADEIIISRIQTTIGADSFFPIIGMDFEMTGKSSIINQDGDQHSYFIEQWTRRH